MPKLEPTVPVQVQLLSAAFVHLAVAVAPTFKHTIDAKAGETAKTARMMDKSSIMLVVNFEFVDDISRKASNRRLHSSFIPNSKVSPPR